MAQKKRKTSSVKASASRKKNQRKGTGESGFLSQLVPYIFLISAIFVALCLIFPATMGAVGGVIRDILFGLLSYAAFVIPIFMLVHAMMWRMDTEKGIFKHKLAYSGFSVLLLSVIMHFAAGGVGELDPVLQYKNGVQGNGGGFIGGLIGVGLSKLIGTVGTLVIAIAVLIVLIMLLFGLTPRTIWVYFARKATIASEERAGRREAMREIRQIEGDKRREEQQRLKEARRAEGEAARQEAKLRAKREYEEKKKREAEEKERRANEQLALPLGQPGRKHGRFDPDVPVDVHKPEIPETEPLKADDAAEQARVDEEIFDEVMRRTKARMENGGVAPEIITDSEDGYESDIQPPPADSENAVAASEVLSEYNRDEAVEEKLEAVAEVGENSEEYDLKKIFVNPEEAELIDKLADAYLRDGKSENRPSDLSEAELASSAELDVERRSLASDLASRVMKNVEAEKSEGGADEPRPYIFPPISLLTQDDSTRDPNIREELKEKADKLVETLNSFKVKTKIVDICRGPTITRYELLPEAGIRVKTIAGLVDDIALNLATSGVRIEAPIPGKSAVGIEVPNKNPSIVHLRTLLEDPRFKENKSKLYVALGQDVAGASIFLDIAKMPHLLIAGATGMGKSVCINSIIMSILYKATPDEVKLILIDPKKVELSIYNGIPHLHTPVVTDPKKAAGSLAWAVNEMERRFSLMEEVGMRDLKNYNEITKNDPDYETLPQMVIIIDELADLMMTASDDVEQSICRLAQKARAAGMHLIIGTQRPSVNVITGLIKSNVPSRIAFTVASQMDSRVIIDRNGAESLIGRGDMLYNPVGAMKPLRVQGSYVSEVDVEKIVEYIKAHCGAPQYSQEVIEQIEREAARCAAGKKGALQSLDGGEVSQDEDPMFRSALELAVESGSISTSLIQRRLSLGYGRAAKLIDRMEQLGYVSAPEGQKPRRVLLSKQDYLELSMK